MTTFTIIDARLYHCGRMARLLRAEHAAALGALGFAPRVVHDELYQRFLQSTYRKAWLIDGRLAGLGGVTGTGLDSAGLVWLALSEAARRYPLAIIKEARRQLDDMTGTRRELATSILPGDDAAKRLAVMLGFHISDDGPGAAALSRAGRRNLREAIDSNPACHYPCGSGHVILMGYHREAESRCVSQRLH